METVAAVLPQIAPWVGDSGVCEDSPKVLTALNAVRLLLWDKGDFEFTTEKNCFCTQDCCVVLPARHRQIRTAWICKSPIDLRGEWYQAVTGWPGCCGRVCGTHRTIREVGGYHITFREPDEVFYLGIKGEDVLDTGTEITFEALDAGSKLVRIPLTVGAPYVRVDYTATLLRLLRVSKPRTKNRIRVYAIDPETMEEHLIALYEGGDVNPHFKKYQMPSKCGEQLIVQTKLEYFDLTEGTELVEFNLNVLIQGLLAIRARSNSDNQEFLDNLNLAVLEANRSMSDREVKASVPIKIKGSRTPRNLIPPIYG